MRKKSRFLALSEAEVVQLLDSTWHIEATEAESDGIERVLLQYRMPASMAKIACLFAALAVRKAKAITGRDDLARETYEEFQKVSEDLSVPLTLNDALAELDAVDWENGFNGGEYGELFNILCPEI